MVNLVGRVAMRPTTKNNLITDQQWQKDPQQILFITGQHAYFFMTKFPFIPQGDQLMIDL